MTTLERIRHRRKLQKIRQIKKICVITFMTIILVTICTVSISGVKSLAQDNNTITTYKYFTSVVIEHGDTLYAIADKHTEGFDVDINNYISEVMHINHLEDASSIQSGQYLIIPYYSNELKVIDTL